MNGDVWISGLMSDHSLGNKDGVRWKYPNEDWTRVEHRVPMTSSLGSIEGGVVRRRSQTGG